MSEIRDKTKQRVEAILSQLVLDIQNVCEDYHYDCKLDALKALWEIPELAIVDRDAGLPSEKGVNISVKFNPELTAPANQEVVDTAIMAYQQAQQDMKRAGYVLEVK